MAELAGAVSLFDASTEDLYALQRPKASYALAVRLLLASIVKPSAEYDAALHDLQRHRSELRKLMIGRQVNMVGGNTEDTLGFLHDDDAQAALLISHELLVNALQAYLIGLDDLYLGNKWVLRKLRRSAPANFPYSAVIELLCPREPVDPETLIARRIEFAQACVGAAITEGWEHASSEEWTGWQGRTDGIRRDRGWLPMRITDAVLLTSAKTQVRLSPRLVRLWVAADGSRSRTDLVQFATALGISADNAEKGINKLFDLGALR
ncbi:hypothetical protein R8Z50_11155 [Longispora sp. K20-0274]|uniref:hypothetical protein n=1 Tax=Longispora sp. K20-0274 TaxID=3088255 RepID=UPI00399C13A7